MQFNKLLRQRKPQSCALKLFSKGGLELREHPEELGEVIGPNPDPGIRDSDFDALARVLRPASRALLAGAWTTPRGHGDPPLRRREFYRIRKQIIKDLLEACGIGRNNREIVVHREFERLPLLLGLRTDSVYSRRDGLPDWERLELKVDLTRLNLGQVKKIIDQ